MKDAEHDPQSASLPWTLVLAAAGLAALSMPSCFATGHAAHKMGEVASSWGSSGWFMLPVAVVLAGALPCIAVVTGLRARRRYMRTGGASALDRSLKPTGMVSSMSIFGLLLAPGRRQVTMLWAVILIAAMTVVTAASVALLMFISGFGG